MVANSVELSLMFRHLRHWLYSLLRPTDILESRFGFAQHREYKLPMLHRYLRRL